MIIKYKGENPSYTAGKVKFTKKENVKTVNAQIGKILLKSKDFEEVKENDAQKGASTEDDKE